MERSTTTKNPLPTWAKTAPTITTERAVQIASQILATPARERALEYREIAARYDLRLCDAMRVEEELDRLIGSDGGLPGRSYVPAEIASKSALPHKRGHANSHTTGVTRRAF